jgi:hypothetical protein
MNSQVVARIAFLLLIVACVVPLGLRSLISQKGPSIEIVHASGDHQTIPLAQMKTKPSLEREGSYQNQYGNWSASATYRGILLTDLLGDSGDYAFVEVVAGDGYRMTVDRWRVVDMDYPLVLAYQKDGIEVPDWEDGFSIAVLPDDGSISNVEYGVESAGSYWVKQVTQLILTSE